MFAICDPTVYKIAVLCPISDIIDILYHSKSSVKSTLSISNARPINVIQLKSTGTDITYYPPEFHYVDDVSSNGVFPAFERNYQSFKNSNNFDLECNIALRDFTSFMILEINTDELCIPVIYCSVNEIIRGHAITINTMFKLIMRELEQKGLTINNFSISEVISKKASNYASIHYVLSNQAFIWENIDLNLKQDI